MTIQLRNYRDEDYEPVKQNLEEGGTLYPNMDSKENLRRKTRRNPDTIIVACEDNKVIGNVFLVEDGWAAFVYRLAVRKSHRGKEIGRLLMEEVEKRARTKGYHHIYLLVKETSEKLHQWYQKQGYEKGHNIYIHGKNSQRMMQQRSARNAQQEEWPGNPLPSKWVIYASVFATGDKALDVGMGEGRNALYLAREGFNVTGIDRDPACVAKCKTIAERDKLSLTAIIGNIQGMRLTEEYHMVVAHAVLHFLTEDEVQTAIRAMQDKTAQDGINGIAVLTEDNPKKGFPHLFRRNELQSYYQTREWEILQCRERVTRQERHGDGPWHRHAVAEILARKKGKSKKA